MRAKCFRFAIHKAEAEAIAKEKAEVCKIALRQRDTMEQQLDEYKQHTVCNYPAHADLIPRLERKLKEEYQSHGEMWDELVKLKKEKEELEVENKALKRTEDCLKQTQQIDEKYEQLYYATRKREDSLLAAQALQRAAIASLRSELAQHQSIGKDIVQPVGDLTTATPSQ